MKPIIPWADRRPDPKTPLPGPEGRMRVGFILPHWGPGAGVDRALPLFVRLDRTRFEVVLFGFEISGSEKEAQACAQAAEFHLLEAESTRALTALRQARLDAAVFGASPPELSIAWLAQEGVAALQAELPAKVWNDALAASDGFAASLERAAGTLPPPPTADQALLGKRGLELLCAGDFAGALSAGKWLLELDAKGFAGRFVTGEALLRAGRPARAAEYLRGAVELKPEQSGAWMDLAIAAYSAGRVEEAEEAAKTVLRLDRRRLEAWLLLGDMARRSGDAEGLKKAAQEALRIAPADSRALQMGAAQPRVEQPVPPEAAEAAELYERDQCKPAIDKAREALAKNPESVEALRVLGKLAFVLSGLAREAVEAFRQAVDLAPGDPENESLLAEALDATGGEVESRERLSALLRANPRCVPALLALGRARFRRRENEAAEVFFRAACEIDPNSAEAARSVGDSLKRRGILAEAMQWHWRAAGAEPAARREGRRRAVFIAQLGSLWINVHSVYEAFRADPDWETVVVAMPYLHPYGVLNQEPENAFSYLEERGIEYVPVDRFELKSGCADVVFVPTPWNDVRPGPWSNESLMALGLRIAYVPYLFETAADEVGQFSRRFHQEAWMIFSRSEDHKAMYQRMCPVGSAHVAVTGHPKMDALARIDESRDPSLERWIGERRAVCWNPHFNFVPDGTAFGAGYSTFLRWERFMIDEFSRRDRLALLLRPHPLFFGALTRSGVWTQEQVTDFFDRCQKAGNVHVDRRPSYLPVFAASDAMMSDISTFVLEYPMTGKPLLYLRNPRGAGVMPGLPIESFCEAAETEEGIRAFLDGVQEGRDPRAAERRKAFEAMFVRPEGGSGLAIKRAIDERLASELPERA